VLGDTGSGDRHPGLVRRLVEIPPGEEFDGVTSAAGELWFVIAGSARLGLDGDDGPRLTPDRGLWVPAGVTYQVTADPGVALRLDVVSLPAAVAAADSTAQAGSDVTLTRDLSDCQVETTGDRKFRVLFGPGHGCPVATQFVGEIPPGRAPEHSHPYDELVLILAGTGVAHAGGTDRELGPGTCLHLPPGMPHCLENTGHEILRVLGVFHPADSPAAKLHPAAG
jgi:mannose-6-phosphate isomerase-like protein (cupin superfamily)